MMRTQRRGAGPPNRAAWPDLGKRCQEADDVLLCQPEKPPQSRGPCSEKELRERHERVRRAPGQKPREILCSSQKRKLIFAGTVRTHKMSFLMATALPTRGGAYKRKIQLHTPAPHRQAGCGEPRWKEKIQFKSRSNALSWWTPEKDKRFPPLHANAVAPS